ncbi:Pre-rRNA-processing protein ipi3 [Actinomortierella ambigua]|nr:Pre-rRNA-processing protein ipi3 [Actinomortierella ambigua]
MFVELALTSSSDASDSTAYLWNLHTGSMLASFKQNVSPLGCLAMVNNPRQQGSVFLAAQADKGMLHVYSYQKDQVEMKIVLPDKLVCLATSTKGTYCVGGTQSGRVHIWKVSTGVLHRTFDAHYKKITALRFSADDSVLFTGSEDAAVHVWMLSDLLDESSSEEPAPHYSWTDHTLSITDIQCGIGNFHGTRVLTSSLDHTCKLWDLSTGTLLTTFLFPTKITALAFDPSERFFLAASGTPATSSGSSNSKEPNTTDYVIYQALLYKSKHTEQGYTTIEAVDGDSGLEQIGLGGAKRGGRGGAGAGDLVFKGHHHPITRMSLSFDGSALVSGDSKGAVLVWDVASRQMVREMKHHKGSVSSVHTMFQPADLYSNTTLTKKPKLQPVGRFGRLPPSRLGSDEGLNVIVSNIAEDIPSFLTAAESEVDHHHFHTGPSSSILVDKEEQLLAGATNAHVYHRSHLLSSSGGGDVSSTQNKDYQALEQKYRELEARVATLQQQQSTPQQQQPQQPVVTQNEVSSALEGLRSSGGAHKRRRA